MSNGHQNLDWSLLHSKWREGLSKTFTNNKSIECMLEINVNKNKLVYNCNEDSCVCDFVVINCKRNVRNLKELFNLVWLHHSFVKMHLLPFTLNCWIVSCIWLPTSQNIWKAVSYKKENIFTNIPRWYQWRRREWCMLEKVRTIEESAQDNLSLEHYI